MTLEDFFTTTEMKDGLTAPARVEQLISVMQKEKDNVVKNVGEATRQWSTVASTLAATENKYCLDLFLQLDGLSYIHSWLKEAQTLGGGTDDSYVEDSVSALLGAIEKLNVDNQKADACGILMTIENLLGHNSSRVQERARSLYDRWKQTHSDVVAQDIEKVVAVCVDQPNATANHVLEHERLQGLLRGSSSPNGRPIGSENDEKNFEPSTDEMMPSIYSKIVQPEGDEANNIESTVKSLDHASTENGPPDPLYSSDMLKVDETISIPEAAQGYPSGVTTEVESGAAVATQGTVEGQSDGASPFENDNAKQKKQIESSENLGAMDTSIIGDPTNIVESKVDHGFVEDANEVHACPVVSPSGDVKTAVSVCQGGADNSISPKHCKTTVVSNDTCHMDEFNADEFSVGILHNSNIGDHQIGKPEEPSTYLSRVEESGVSEESDMHDDTDEADDDDVGNDFDLPRSAVDARDADVIERSDVDLDYGGFDPLELARQVAIEVEREVDCREPSYSSSERASGGGIRPPGSPDSINVKIGKAIQDPANDARTGPNLSAAAGDRTLKNAENLSAGQESCVLDTDASRVREAAQTSESNSDKRDCGFDLNEEVLPDEMDLHINPVATPISVVSASRATAASTLPVAPLQFEGALGWKGSAETSAFRRAPRRISEGEKSLCASGSSNSSRQRQDYLDIDLNVAEGEDDKIAELMLGKEIPNFSVPSDGEPSVNVIPERSNRMQLDLNCVSDGGDAPSHCRKEEQLLAHRNGRHSPSHSSSSSSRQHSLRNIDLNDQPSLANDFPYPANFGKSSKTLFPSGGSRPDDSVISIFGTRVEVRRKEVAPQTLPLANGRISDHLVDASLTGSGSVLGLGSSALPYAHPSVYGYNGPSLGPSIPFSSSMFGLGGHIPYMMDSRGTPISPQILGPASSSALPPAFSQPPFIMNIAGGPSSSNGVVPLGNNFDLNSGMMMDGGNRDTGGFRQFLGSSQSISIDEHMRVNSQLSSSSGVGGKRKETDGGWEPYPFNFKHHQSQPPWN